MVEVAPMAVALMFVGVDVVSGVIKACAAHALSSQKMRAGFWHKVANCFMILFSAFCAGVATYVNFLPSGFAAAYVGICAYIVSMEFISILENICSVNPELSIKRILQIFNINDNDEKE